MKLYVNIYNLFYLFNVFKGKLGWARSLNFLVVKFRVDTQIFVECMDAGWYYKFVTQLFGYLK